MANTDLLIVALGNPGVEYETTRHNIGWLILDDFAEAKKLEFTEPSNYLIAEFKYAGRQVAIMKPLTYMNLSGKAVRNYANKHGIQPDRIVVISDEYNFPLGKIALKKGGSDGGHNGLKSLIAELGTPVFWRLRAGISKDFGPGGLVDYVLGQFGDEEIPELNIAIEKGAKAVATILKNGPQKAVASINIKKVEPIKAAPNDAEKDATPNMRGDANEKQ
jgi:PTH1 family peptidyl-tRNA hydrolase